MWGKGAAVWSHNESIVSLWLFFTKFYKLQIYSYLRSVTLNLTKNFCFLDGFFRALVLSFLNFVHHLTSNYNYHV